MSVKEWTLGETRYLTYYLIFPDGDTWWDQEAFWGPLSTWLKITTFARQPKICVDLLRKGESRWKERNGMIHRVVIESVNRGTKWGVQRK